MADGGDGIRAALIVGLGVLVGAVYLEGRRADAADGGPSYSPPPRTGAEPPRVRAGFVPATPYYAVAPGPQVVQSQGVEWPAIPKAVLSVPALLAGESASWPVGGQPSPLISTAAVGGMTEQTVPLWANQLP